MSQESSIHFEIVGGVDRTLDIERYKDEINFTIDAPWAGDTESGFGQTLSATLKKEDAIRLATWIKECFDG